MTKSQTKIVCVYLDKQANPEPIFLKRCTCGTELTSDNAKYIGSMEDFELDLYNCPDCHSTVSVRK